MLREAASAWFFNNDDLFPLICRRHCYSNVGPHSMDGVALIQVTILPTNLKLQRNEVNIIVINYIAKGLIATEVTREKRELSFGSYVVCMFHSRQEVAQFAHSNQSRRKTGASRNEVGKCIDGVLHVCARGRERRRGSKTTIFIY